MSRKTKKTVILAALETVAGTAVATIATDALLISEASFEPQYENVDRDLLRPTMGHGGSLVGDRHIQISFTVELAAAGTAGSAPAWGKLLQACAFAEVISAGQYVEYLPVSESLKTLTIRYSADGVIHTASGCMGTFSMAMEAGSRPTLAFTFIGKDDGPVAAATPAATLTQWQVPEVLNAQNTQKIKLGGTYANGAVTGGTEFCSRGLTLEMANETKYMTMLGCSAIDITNRLPTGSLSLEVSAAQEVAMRAEINANTATSMSVLHGSAAGKQVLVMCPRIVRINPKYEDYEGKLLLSHEFNAEPVSGNDEVRIVAM